MPDGPPWIQSVVEESVPTHFGGLNRSHDGYHVTLDENRGWLMNPPTKPTPSLLHVVSMTFSPNFVSLSIAADNFFDDSPSLFVIFQPSLNSSPSPEMG